MKYNRLFLFLTLVSALILIVGCSSGEKKYVVSGSVSYQGTPVENGTISFVPDDVSKSPDGGIITNGQYSCNVRPGTMTVQISAAKILPTPKGEDPTIIKYKEIIPVKYGTESTLKVEIKGTQTEDFRLE